MANHKYTEPILLFTGEQQQQMPTTQSRMKGGVPHQSFVKEVLRVGKYTHPTKGWTLAVDRERLHKLAATFNKMRSNGVPIPFVKDHKVDADHTMGYVNRLMVDGDRLLARYKAEGKDNIEKTQIVDHVSVGIHPNFKDGSGNSYGEAIYHIGLTPDPIVTGQTSVQIAASRGQPSDPVTWVLASTNGDTDMDLKLLAKALGVDAIENDDLALEAVDTVVAGLRKDITALKESKKTLSTELAASKDKVVELSAGDEDGPNAELVEEHAQTVQEKCAEVCAKLQLTPDATKQLSLALTGPPEGRNVFLLTRVGEANEQGIRPVRASVILSAIQQIDAAAIIKAGEKTTGQALSFARSDSESAKSEAAVKEDVKTRAEEAYATG